MSEVSRSEVNGSNAIPDLDKPEVKRLRIEITSDFMCPWCFIGHAHLQQAVAQLRAPTDVEWVWYPFELNPGTPKAGIDRHTYRTRKFGSWAYSQQLDAQTVKVGQASGVEFRYDLMQVTPNTMQAHRLTQWASGLGKATEMAERIFKAYFTEGQDIGDIAVLSDLATDIGADMGLEGDSVRDFLNSEQGVEAIRALEQAAVTRGVQSVPTIQVGEVMLLGGQPVDVFLEALQSAAQELSSR